MGRSVEGMRWDKGFNLTFNNYSVISRRCLVATGVVVAGVCVGGGGG